MAFVATLAFLGMAGTAMAIPTPDVVVNVFTGMSQILVVVAGAVATVFHGLWKTLRGGGRGSSRMVNWLLGGALVLSVTGLAWQHQHATALEHERTDTSRFVVARCDPGGYRARIRG